MNTIQIIERVYYKLISMVTQKHIPISLRAPTVVGTVQDDPFDGWIANAIKAALPDIEVFHAGKLTTPDLILRHKASNSLHGLDYP